MKVLATVLLIGMLAAPVFAQNKPTIQSLVLENLNLQIRVMQLEYVELKAKRDRLIARLQRQKAQRAKVKAKEKENTEPWGDD